MSYRIAKPGISAFNKAGWLTDAVLWNLQVENVCIETNQYLAHNVIYMYMLLCKTDYKKFALSSYKSVSQIHDLI